jgi:hypothetical protein
MKKHKDSLRQKMKKNVAATKTIIAGTMAGGAVLLFVGANFAQDRNIIPPSQLATTQQFPNQLGGMIEIIHQEMDWKQNIMKIDIQVSDDITMKNLVANVFVKKDTGSTLQFIPTIDNKATLFVKNLNNHFQVLSLAIENTGLTSNQVDTNVFDDKQTASSSIQENKEASDNSNVLYFYISENSKYLKTAPQGIKVKSQKDYAVDALNDEIKFQNSQIDKMKTAISKLTDLQGRDKAQIEEAKKQNEYMTGDQLDKNQKHIMDLQNDIQHAQTQVQTAEKNIEDIHKKIDKMQKQITDIQTGKYQFPEDSQSKELK